MSYTPSEIRLNSRGLFDIMTIILSLLDVPATWLNPIYLRKSCISPSKNHFYMTIYGAGQRYIGI